MSHGVVQTHRTTPLQEEPSPPPPVQSGQGGNTTRWLQTKFRLPQATTSLSDVKSDRFTNLRAAEIEGIAVDKNGRDMELEAQSPRDVAQDYTKVIASVPSASVETYSAFSPRQRGWICVLAACGSFWSPVTAHIYFPAIPQIAADLGVSTQAVNLSVTIYLIAMGVSPTWWGAAADVLGRRPVYIATLTLYVATSIGLCFTYSYGALVVLRFFQACGSASVIAIGAGTIGDIASAHERGKFYGLYGISLQAAPALGPILGGILTQTLGWRAIFWVLSGGSGLVVILLALLLPETLRSIVGNGSRRPPIYNRPLIPVLTCKNTETSGDEPQVSLQTRVRRIRLLDPLRLLFERDVLCNLLFMGVVYAVYTASTISLASLLESTYGLSSLNIGLCFIANGSGCVIASPLSGWILTRSFRHYASRHVDAEGKLASSSKDIRDLSTFPIERARLAATWIVIPAFIGTCLIYGWLIDRGVFLAGPLVMQFIIGFGFSHMMATNSTLMVDVMPTKAASCTASNNLVRCLMAAVMTSFVQPMLSALGPGWTFTLLSGVCVLTWPLIWLEWANGMRWRAERKQRMPPQQLA